MTPTYYNNPTKRQIKGTTQPDQSKLPYVLPAKIVEVGVEQDMISKH